MKPEPCTYIVGDLPPDHRGDVPCGNCGRPQANRAHKPPTVPAGAREHDAAVLGEHEES